MILLSICPGHEGLGADFMIVRSLFRNVRKHYVLEGRRQVIFGKTSDSLEDFVRSEYQNPEFAKPKRLFSQDGRPTKDIVTGPTMVFDASQTGPETVVRLREDGVPVEAFFQDKIDEKGSWRKETIGQALGNNYYVPAGVLYDVLCCVLKEDRLIAGGKEDKDPGMVKLFEKMRTGSMAADNPVKPTWLTTLAMPIWFRETIRYSRVYRA